MLTGPPKHPGSPNPKLSIRTKTTLGAPAPLGGFNSKRGGGVALRASISVIAGCCGSGRGRIERSGVLSGESLMDGSPQLRHDIGLWPTPVYWGANADAVARDSGLIAGSSDCEPVAILRPAEHERATNRFGRFRAENTLIRQAGAPRACLAHEIPWPTLRSSVTRCCDQAFPPLSSKPRPGARARQRERQQDRRK